MNLKKTKKRKIDFLNNTLQKFSIRKYSVGVACVLIGTLSFIGLDKNVSADEISGEPSQAPEVEETGEV
uniref:YSIRK-type signal peptide-containing protein n=1 Tax=Jeotgalicoccus marinus TaxID=516700 RepID=UPI00056AE692